MNEEQETLLETAEISTPDIQLIFNGTVKCLSVTVNHFEGKTEEKTE